MKFKKPVLLLFITAMLILLVLFVAGFMPSFSVGSRDYSLCCNKMPVFDDDTRLLYVLQNADAGQLLNADFDVAVVDPDDSKLNPENLVSLKKQGKIIIAYLSIGEAEDYRSYWEPGWYDNAPCFVDEENPDWKGNYKVRFWDRQWQDIIYDRLDSIIETGYDGVYLDVIDAYRYYRARGYDSARIEMINFVYSISWRAKSFRKDFLIIPQNGEELISDLIYLKSIDGAGREDIWFTGDNPANLDETCLALEYLTLLKKNGKFVFAICYAEDEITKSKFLNFSNNYGFIPFLGEKQLDVIYEF